MAETLTVDTSPQTESAPDSLTPDEQDSLAVGEKIMAEQEQLLAGKYKNAEELEKAYVELQSKLGSQDTEETEEAPSDVESSPVVGLINDASSEYAENGQLTPETLAKFSDMNSTDLVNAYMEIQSQQEAPEAVDLSESDVNTVMNFVGGEESYKQLTDWASNNLDEISVAAFDAIINTGSVESIKLVVSGLKSQYENSNGYEGRMLSGKPPTTSGDIFRSQAEVVEAMSNPKYEKDPAYRQDILEKLDRSNLEF